MLHATTFHLKFLSGICWYIGSIVLVLKGSALVLDAERLRPGQAWTWLTIVAALFLGGLKARFVFNQFCRNNLARIEALDQPKIWQFFRPSFFGLLFLMMVSGALLSQLAQNNYPALIAVAMLDFSIAAALICSSHHFWT